MSNDRYIVIKIPGDNWIKQENNKVKIMCCLKEHNIDKFLGDFVTFECRQAIERMFICDEEYQNCVKQSIAHKIAKEIVDRNLILFEKQNEKDFINITGKVRLIR